MTTASSSLAWLTGLPKVWIINAVIALMLWRQANQFFELDGPNFRFWAWLCVAFSAANGAVVLAEIL